MKRETKEGLGFLLALILFNSSIVLLYYFIN